MSHHAQQPEAVALELFTNRFAAIAAEMGEVLRRTALSTNIRDRLDFSCALLDRAGRLVVNAPHIPVHLGALGPCVRAVASHLELGPGDSAVTNHPAFGGSHLPDVTVITPVDVAGQRVGWVANRAHHAEIGGCRPGSMPPAATCLAEEGVVIPPLRLVRGGEARWRAVEELLGGGRWPSRAVAENLADLSAALAANQRGVAALTKLVEEHGGKTVSQYLDALRNSAAERLRAALAKLPSGRLEATERLDDGTPIRVAITIDGDRATVDFSGSGAVHPGNLNAPRAVSRSAVLYCLRLLLAQPLPLNEGLLEPIDLIFEQGILDPPFSGDPASDPAVVGGNVETSQRIVDTLLKALDLAAGSQGTMNNLLFGNDRFGYYETVCGGAGAGPGFAGASAVHTHMTNTRITDPEVLESRYPVRLESFALRPGSGGRGRYSGGDGVRREMLFLEPIEFSLLSQHRRERPYGSHGGEPGALGRQRLIRADGSEEELAGIAQADLRPGDRLLLETPGGGGWGRFDEDEQEPRRKEGAE